MQEPFVVPLDQRVLTEPEAAKFCGFSPATLRRRVESDEGPRVTRLSKRRIGYRVAHLRAWLDDQVEEAAS
jgi:predicted DNA-binding transcriptional regulator AlpA